MEANVLKEERHQLQGQKRSSNQPTVFARIRNLRLT